jgi:TPP-dependent pyruvate/acetoin dehydrogenase alpha subunit
MSTDNSIDGVPLDTALDLLRTMITSRCIEDRIHILYKQSRIKGRVLSGRGQEAIPVGATAALEKGDIVAPVHRDLGTHLVRGTTPTTVMLHYFGRAAGPSRGRDGDIHFGEWNRGVFPMVSHLPDSWPVIAGISLGFALREERHVAMAFCGDGATSTGAWHETLNFCSVFQTPAIFVVENNKYAYSTPTEQQYRVQRLSDRAKAYGIRGQTIDGNDVLEVYQECVEAVKRARAGEGPTLLEAVTMRIDGHAIHDEASYVPDDLLDAWRNRDPIERLTSRLEEFGLDSALIGEMWTKVRAEVLAAVEEAESARLPEPSELTEGLYAHGRSIKADAAGL